MYGSVELTLYTELRRVWYSLGAQEIMGAKWLMFLYLMTTVRGQAKATQPQNGDVRLVEGGSDYEGVLQVYYNGQYGEVCDDGFGATQGQVACRNMNRGYKNVVYGYQYGDSDFLLDNVVCNGTEENLAQCTHNSWGDDDCKPNEHVYLTCSSAVDKCLKSNGGCIHECSNNVCKCPSPLHLDRDNTTCKDCGLPPALLHGTMLSLDLGITSNGAKAYYECNKEGYTINGSGFVTCELDGQWKPLPECQRVDCGEPDSVENASKKDNHGHHFEDKIIYLCNEGRNLYGDPQITCQSNGNWTTSPTCEKVNCGEPEYIGNARRKADQGHSFEDTVTFECEKGHILHGNTNITCLSDGNWTASPSCDGIRCGEPYAVANSERHVTGHYFNDSAIYDCNIGYVMSGVNSSICEENGFWSLPPECYAIQCKAPPFSENLHVMNRSRYAIGDTISHRCPPGFLSDSYEFITCQYDGEWSDYPKCIRVYCGGPFDVLNSHRTVTGHHYNDTVEYTCNTGFIMSGSDFSVCQEDGHWSIPPECQEISCGYPPFIEHGHLEGITGYEVTSTAKYECDNDYDLIGYDVIICQANGEWTETPLCLALSQHVSPSLTVTNSNSAIIKPSLAAQKASTWIANFNITTLTDSSTTASSQPGGSYLSRSTQTVSSEVNGTLQKDGLAMISPAFNYDSGAEQNNTIKSPEKQGLFSQEQTIPFINTHTLKPSKHIICNLSSDRSEEEKESTDTKTTLNKRNVIIGCSVFAAFSLLTIILTLVYVKFGKERGQREHNFVPVSNALYETDGQMMTTYSFKQ